MIFVLIGHRTAGKSALGASAALNLGAHFFDTDDAVAVQLGCPINQWIKKASWEEFRLVEQEIFLATLSQAFKLAQCSPVVISTGAGLGANPLFLDLIYHAQQGSKVPINIFWLQRQIDSRLYQQRPRLLTSVSLAEEIQRITETRDPVYRSHCHQCLNIKSHWSFERSALELTYLLKVSTDFYKSSMAGHLTLTASRPNDLILASLAGLGVELRSDLWHPEGELVHNTLKEIRGRSYFSIRDDKFERSWIKQIPKSWIIDWDVRLGPLHQDLTDGSFDGKIASCHDTEHWLELKSCADLGMECKVALSVNTVDELRDLVLQIQSIPRTRLYPIGERWSWYRLFDFNFDPSAVLPNFVSLPDVSSAAGQPSLQLVIRSFARKNGQKGPLHRYLLLGSNTSGSYGIDLHGQVLNNGIYASADILGNEWDGHLIELLQLSGVRGVSVTSPGKAWAGSLVNKPPLNTLSIGTSDCIQGTDTDRQGARAWLAPGGSRRRVTIVGNSVTAQIILREGPREIPQASFRVISARSVNAKEIGSSDLVINASGRELPTAITTACKKKSIEIWDIRYDVAEAARDGEVWFYEQARGQWQAWITLDPGLSIGYCPGFIETRNSFLKYFGCSITKA